MTVNDVLERIRKEAVMT